MMQTPVQEVEISIEGARKLVGMREAMDRLEKNRDFKLLISNGYLTDEALRLTGLLSEVAEDRDAPKAIGGMSKDYIVSQLQAIAHFAAYLREIDRKTDGIHATLHAYEQERELRIREAEQV